MDSKKIKMDREVLKKMRGYSVVTNTSKYIMEIDEVPEEFFPVFTIKNYTVTEAKKVAELSAETGDDAEAQNEILEDLIRTHIVGWKNLFDLSVEDDEDPDTVVEWEFKPTKTGVCSKAQYYELSSQMRALILNYILALKGVK